MALLRSLQSYMLPILPSSSQKSYKFLECDFKNLASCMQVYIGYKSLENFCGGL